MVLSPGTSEEIDRDGEGWYRAAWDIAIATIALANTRQNTQRIIRRYASVWRLIMVQQSALGGFARGVDWISESYDVIDDGKQPLEVSRVEFQVSVGEVANTNAGPRTAAERLLFGWPAADRATSTLDQAR